MVAPAANVFFQSLPIEPRHVGVENGIAEHHGVGQPGQGNQPMTVGVVEHFLERLDPIGAARVPVGFDRATQLKAVHPHRFQFFHPRELILPGQTDLVAAQMSRLAVQIEISALDGELAKTERHRRRVIRRRAADAEPARTWYNTGSS